MYSQFMMHGQKNIVISVSVRQCGTRLPVDGFSWNLVFKIFLENLSRKFQFH